MIRHRKAGHSHPQARRRNFRDVQIIAAHESNRREEVEQEDEEHRRILRRLVALGHATGDGQGRHAERHTSSTKHEELSATKAIDREEGNEGGEEFPGQAGARENPCRLAAEVQTFLKDCC